VHPEAEPLIESSVNSCIWLAYIFRSNRIANQIQEERASCRHQRFDTERWLVKNGRWG